MDKYTRTVMLPHFGSYYVPFSYLVTHGLEQNYLVPPPMTKKRCHLAAAIVQTMSARRLSTPWAVFWRPLRRGLTQ